MSEEKLGHGFLEEKLGSYEINLNASSYKSLQFFSIITYIHVSLVTDLTTQKDDCPGEKAGIQFINFVCGD